MGSLDECKAQIARELRYQSSLDLDESTCAAGRPAAPHASKFHAPPDPRAYPGKRLQHTLCKGNRRKGACRLCMRRRAHGASSRPAGARRGARRAVRSSPYLEPARRYAAIRHLPLAKDLVRASRQQLVAHLDTYSKRHPTLFHAARPAPPRGRAWSRLPGRRATLSVPGAPTCRRPYGRL